MPELNTMDTQHLAELPDGYRMTELGPLPEEWRVVAGRDLFRISNLRVKDLRDKFEGNILSVTRYDGIIPQTQKFNKKVAGDDLSSYKVVRQHQLVYGFPINEGVIGISFYPLGAVSPAYQVWDIVDENVDLVFIDYLVKQNFMINQYMRFASNVVHRRKNLHPHGFMQCLFPLPPLAEQRAIAYVLRAVQRARESTERVIAAARTLKKSLMRHLFTYGAVPIEHAERIPMQDTELGVLPAHWQVVKLGEVARYINGYAFKPSDWSVSGKPIIRIQNLTGTSAKVNYFEGSIDKRYLVDPGDILISWSASLDVFIWNGEQAWLNQHIFKVTDISTQCNKFFLFFAVKHIIGNIRSRTHGSTMKHITQKEFLRTFIPLPPLDEQIEIARILRAVDRKIEAEEARRQALEGLFRSLLHQLMTAKRRLPAEFVAQFEQGTEPTP